MAAEMDETPSETYTIEKSPRKDKIRMKLKEFVNVLIR